MRRIKLLLAVVAAMTMLMVVSAPAALANDFDHDCFPFCSDHRDFDHHDFDEDDLFINDFDDFDDFDEDFVELDDCEIIGFDGDDAIVVCELDF